MNRDVRDPANPIRANVAPDSIDLVIATYKCDVDRTLIRENLRKSHEDRIRSLQELQRFADELRRSGNVLRGKS